MEIGGTMKNKKSVLINTLIFAAIVIFINLVSLSIFYRMDFSKGKIYSLSKASKTAVRNLDDRMVIKAYFTKNLPGELASAQRFTKDILSDYQAYSRGKLRFEFIDPASAEDLKKEAQQNGISPFNMRVVQNDKLEIREVYLGLSFMYQGKSEVIPIVQNTQGLEYDITSMIKKITAKGLKKVAFFEQEGAELDPMLARQGITSFYQSARQLLSGNYELKDTDLNTPIDVAVEVLIFTGIEDSLSSEQLFNLDQFIMKGGNVLAFQEKVTTVLQEQRAETINSNLFDLLKHYGITIKNNIVKDANCGSIQIQRRQGFFNIATPVNYPFMPMINKFSKENLITKNLDTAVLYFASEIDTTKVGAGLSCESLLVTSSNSGETRGPRFDINVQPFMNADLKTMLLDDPKTVSAIFTGTFKTYFGNDQAHPDALLESSSAKFLLVSDSDFIKEGSGASVQANNMDFFLNSVDYLASESTLIEIRSRETEHKPLKELKNGPRKFVKWLNILLPSLLLILVGFIRYRRELQNRKHIGELYE